MPRRTKPRRDSKVAGRSSKASGESAKSNPSVLEPSVPSRPVGKAKVFRDPVHDLITLTPEDRWIVDLIDSKEFQRLRRIRQLGLAHLAYPGAKHSRFVHSLGVFDIARRMIRKLLHRHAADNTVKADLDRNSKTIKIAALLHDLGHGPFSHVFERVFGEIDDSLPKHDEWSCRIIRDPETEVNACLGKHGIPIDEVCSLISDSETPPQEPYLKDIVSSQLDADRMDYLLRDSAMTGSKYGQFDAEWILNALIIAKPRIGTDTYKKLCLDASKGTGAIEGLLFARRQMLSHVYGHKTTRAFEAQLVQTLRLALRLRSELPDDTPAPVRTLLDRKGSLNTKEYLLLDDEVMWWALRRWASWEVDPKRNSHGLGSKLRQHCLDLVRRRQPWGFKVVPKGEQTLAATRLVERLMNKDDPLQFECYIDRLDDLPYRDYRYYRKGQLENDEQNFFREIYVVEDGIPRRLSEKQSPMIDALLERLEVCRFYFNRKLEQEFAGLLNEFDVC